MARYSLGELPSSPPKTKAKPRASILNITIMDVYPSRIAEWFKIFCEHPHTWLMIRILAIIKLTFYLDIVAVFLLMDVVRTLLFMKESLTDVKDNQKVVTVSDLSTIVDGFIQTAEADSQTDDVEISVEKHDPEECSEAIVPEKEVAEMEMQTEEVPDVVRVFPRLEDVSVQTVEEETPPQPEAVDCEVQTDVETTPEKETVDVESETVVVVTMTVESQTEDEVEPPQREMKDSNYQTDVETLPEKKSVDCGSQSTVTKNAEAENQTDGAAVEEQKHMVHTETQTEEERQTSEVTEVTPEKDQFPKVESVSTTVQTESDFVPIPAFLDRLYDIYTKKNPDDSRRVDFDVNEALNEELKERIAEIEELRSRLTELDTLRKELGEMDKLKKEVVLMEKLKAEFAELEQQKDELQEKLAETEAELTKMETVVDSSLNEYGIMEGRLVAAEREAEVKDNKIEDLCEEIAEWKERCAKMTVSIQSSMQSSYYPENSKADVNLIEI